MNEKINNRKLPLGSRIKVAGFNTEDITEETDLHKYLIAFFRREHPKSEEGEDGLLRKFSYSTDESRRLGLHYISHELYL